MLDAATKYRIDSARDILVGKVPDPKSQVEQITIALIYKFMDDMDRQSEELGGKATFFAGDFKKYRWAQLLDKRFGGHERLLLYAEGIEKMNENKNIPQLFRDIFKGVFLPYRDPETLNLFLKEIDGFSYDHSERLGDAFEYLLSVLGTQGDAGQFRTPRHIIDFIVAVVEPKKTETVLDPACGTAGFLISAYKHILSAHGHGAGGTAPSSNVSGGPASTPAASPCLTPDERARLMTNFRGYDIAPDMCRLARANLYLHGFPNPTIHEYDALSYEDRWDERCDVILANPPFMTPKGGIRPHNRFSIKAKRSEVLFVDYISEHLNPGGRAGVIVPEDIIFQSQNAYKQLRKRLVENYLWAVVSLPAGVFNPYSGVKTSILFLDRNLARQRDQVLFVKIQNDGFDLGAQRRPIEKNDLPGALKVLLEGRVPSALAKAAPRPQPRHALSAGGTAPSTGVDQHTGGPGSTPAVPLAFPAGVETGPPTLRVPRARLLASPDINLSGDRYRVAAARPTGKWPMVKLGEVCSFVRGVTYNKTDESSSPTSVAVLRANNIDLASHALNLADIKYLREGVALPSEKILKKGDIFICTASGSREHLGKVAFVPDDTRFHFGGFMGCVRSTDSVIPQYAFHVMTSPAYDRFIQGLTAGVNINNLKGSELLSFQIPLPPLDEQERIVAELEGYRKVIEGARQILASYKPTIRIDPKWPVVKLSDMITLASGDFLPEKNRQPGPHKVYGGNGVTGAHDHFNVQHPTVVIGRVGAYCGAVHVTEPKSWITDNALYVTQVLKPCETHYLAESLRVLNLNQFAKVGGQPSISQTTVLEKTIPLPPLDSQRQIVAELEAERKLVEANRELIARMEAKTKAKLAEVWGE